VNAYRLLAHGQVYPLSQAGPDFVILKTPAQIPPGRATVIVDVDGDERRWEVLLNESTAAMEVIRTDPAPSPVDGHTVQR
jgi:hypothetical protein